MLYDVVLLFMCVFFFYFIGKTETTKKEDKPYENSNSLVAV